MASSRADEYLSRFPELAAAWVAGVAHGRVPAGRRAVRDYELLAETARGGTGVALRTRPVSLDRPVALKVVLAGEFADPAELRRFRAEAEAAGTLDHPNIVSVFEVCEHRKARYHAMRLVEGGS